MFNFTVKNTMKKYFIFIIICSSLFYACKKKPKCCCTNMSVSIYVRLIDSSQQNKIDTTYLKRNNTLYSFLQEDSISTFTIYANTDSVKIEEKKITTQYLHITSTDTDTILTEIQEVCGYQCTKVWYNGILKYDNNDGNRFLNIVK
jgi:hypothetical protein